MQSDAKDDPEMLRLVDEELQGLTAQVSTPLQCQGNSGSSSTASFPSTKSAVQIQDQRKISTVGVS